MIYAVTTILILVLCICGVSLYNRMETMQKQIEDNKHHTAVSLSVLDAGSEKIWLKLEEHNQTILLLDTFVDEAASYRVPNTRARRKQGR